MDDMKCWCGRTATASAERDRAKSIIGKIEAIDHDGKVTSLEYDDFLVALAWAEERRSQGAVIKVVPLPPAACTR